MVKWRFNSYDEKMQNILENIKEIDNLKTIDINYEEDDEKIVRKIYLYIERSNNPCYGQNGKKIPE